MWITDVNKLKVGSRVMMDTVDGEVYGMIGAKDEYYYFFSNDMHYNGTKPSDFRKQTEFAYSWAFMSIGEGGDFKRFKLIHNSTIKYLLKIGKDAHTVIQG